MAQDYIVLNQDDESRMGTIAINRSVFESIANISISEIDNAIALKDSKLSKYLTVKIDQNRLMITTDIKVKYGANVSQTCELVQNKIYENCLYMTGFKASEVTVNVIGFDI